MRNKVELLELLKTEAKVRLKLGVAAGLCNVVHACHGDRLLLDSESEILLTLIQTERSFWNKLFNSKHHPFYWERYAVSPRIRWINKMIRKYKKK